MLCCFLDIPSYIGILMPPLEALVMFYFLEEKWTIALLLVILEEFTLHLRAGSSGLDPDYSSKSHVSVW